MTNLEALRQELADFECEPLWTDDRLVLAVERACTRLGPLSQFVVACPLSPPAPTFRLLARRPVAPETASRLTQPVLHTWSCRGPAPSRWQLWFELDERMTPGGEPANVHMCSRKDPADRHASLASLAEWNLDGMLPARSRERTEQCIAHLPEHGQILGISWLPTAGEVSVTVALPRSVCDDYLASHACASGLPRLDSLSAWISAASCDEVLECRLTFQDDVCRDLAIVYPQRIVRGGLDDASRSQVRKRLLDEGLCNLAQDAALAAWTRTPTNQTPKTRRWLNLAVSLTATRLTSEAYLGWSSLEV